MGLEVLFGGVHIVHDGGCGRHLALQGSPDSEDASADVAGEGLQAYGDACLALGQVEGDGVVLLVVLVGPEVIYVVVGELLAVAEDVESSVAAIAAPVLEDDFAGTVGVHLHGV